MTPPRPVHTMAFTNTLLEMLRMTEEAHSSKAQVVTDHNGWPVAVNEGSVWWMVADVGPAESPDGGPAAQRADDLFELQLKNGRVLLASHDAGKREWTIARRKVSERCG